MERNEALTPLPERDLRTEVDEQVRLELGSRAVADMCPNCGHELDLPPPLVSGVDGMAPKKRIAAERAATVRQWRKQQSTQVKRVGSQGNVVIIDSGVVSIGADHSEEELRLAFG